MKLKKPAVNPLKFNSKNISFREVKKEIYILNLQTGNFYFLNKSASIVFKLLKAKNPFNRIVEHMLKIYSAEKKVLEKDVKIIISDFKKEKIFI